MAIWRCMHDRLPSRREPPAAWWMLRSLRTARTGQINIAHASELFGPPARAVGAAGTVAAAVPRSRSPSLGRYGTSCPGRKARSLSFLHCVCGRPPLPSSLTRSQTSTEPLGGGLIHSGSSRSRRRRGNRRNRCTPCRARRWIDPRDLAVERRWHHRRDVGGTAVADLGLQLPLLAAVGLIHRRSAPAGGVALRHWDDDLALHVLAIVVVAPPVRRLARGDGAVVFDVGDVVGVLVPQRARDGIQRFIGS